MAEHAKFVLNRANFRALVLKSPELQAKIRAAADRAAGDEVQVESRVGTTRSGAVMMCPAAKEARHGTLTQAIGRLYI